MVQNLEGEKLEGAEACATPAMRRFAVGLKKEVMRFVPEDAATKRA